MGKKENLSDMFIDAFYSDKRPDGEYVNKVGGILKFDYEGSPIIIKITRLDRKNKRCWGEHISLYDFNTGMSHYGHDVDTSDMARIYCRDCQVEIDQPATEEGEVAAINRQREQDKIDEKADEKRDKKRRFRYELLKQDGTIVKYPARKRMKLGEMYKLLDCRMIEVIPAAYYPTKYETVAIYADEEGRFNQENKRNPHMQVLQGDPDLGEPPEWDVVGDCLAEIEVMN